MTFDLLKKVFKAGAPAPCCRLSMQRDTEDIPPGAPGVPGSAEHQQFLGGMAQQLADPGAAVPLACAL